MSSNKNMKTILRSFAKPLLSSKGESLVMVMISLGVVSLIGLGVGNVISSASIEQKRLAQKLELLDLKNSIIGAMANPNNCTCQLNGVVFKKTPTGYVDVTLTDLKAACLSSSVILAKAKDKLPGTQTGLKISSIKITEIKDRGNPGEVAGYFTLQADSSTSVGDFQPIRVLQSFKLDSSQAVSSCTYDSMTARTCARGEMFFGVDAAGTPICRQFPRCSSGSLLQGLDSDGNPICVDGRGIANLPSPTVVYHTVATVPAPPPVVVAAAPVAPATPPPGSGFTLEIPGKSCGGASDKTMDAQCLSACQGRGARSGHNLKGQCEKDPSAPSGYKGVYTCSCVY